VNDGIRLSRIRTAYLLIAANMALMAVLVATIAYVAALRERVSASTAQSIASCNRVNIIRAQVTTNGYVLLSFLSEAAATREALAVQSDATGDEIAARISRDAARAYRAIGGNVQPIAPVNCDRIYNP